jgi:ribonuclease HIII
MKTPRTDKPNTYVATIDLSLAPQLLEDLQSQGFEISKPQYTVFMAKKKGVSCTLYESGKLTVQGKEKEALIEFYLEPQILQKFNYSYGNLNYDASARIGIDESGKGDFFGPLCIAGVFAEGETISEMAALGVRDSKLMDDREILRLGKEIKSHCEHYIVKINPQKYNELYAKFGNLNHLLAWGHATVIDKLVEKTQCQNIIIDQFASEHVVETAVKRKQLKIKLTQRHKGEEDVVVAAASILARSTFVEGLEQLGEEFICHFPKGASQAVIKFGKEFVKKYGKEELGRVAKTHFKTLDAILGEPPQSKFPFRKPFGKQDE